jgi:geranylgeranyl pyrophosphate synthase
MTLNEIFAPIAKALRRVKQQLRTQLDSLYNAEQLYENQQAHIDRFIEHFFRASGKGLRPALVLLSARASGPLQEDDAAYQSLIKLAAAVELIHSASLAHDDVVDKAATRRNQATLNEKYGTKIAVVVGDLLVLQAFALLLGLEGIDWRKKERIFKIIHCTAQKMCLGELCEDQILSEKRRADRGEYLQFLEHKTASLMSASCECGAILTGKDPGDYQNMANFGLHFGLAFQLADDLKDQDSLLQENAELIPLAQEYINKAKHDLQSVNASPEKQHLMELCDILLPGERTPGIFDQG